MPINHEEYNFWVTLARIQRARMALTNDSLMMQPQVVQMLQKRAATNDVNAIIALRGMRAALVKAGYGNTNDYRISYYIQPTQP